MSERQSLSVLRAAGIRATTQRLNVLDALEGRNAAVSAQELHHELRVHGGRPGLATIYRVLAALAEAGVVDTFAHDGEQRFRLCRSSHHHHLVCRGCGMVQEVTSDEVESWVDRVARARKFRVTGHSADVYGFCSACS